MSAFLTNLSEHRELFARLDVLDDAVGSAVAAISSGISGGGKVMFCGNGGSAADSQHLAAEFTGRFLKDRRPLPALSLTTDTSALTCISNDYDFRSVFSRQVVALGRSGDCLVGISTSGNSPNVIAAFEAARELSITTIGLLGRDGGKLRQLSDIALIVDSNVTARIQEAHILIGHALCGAVEKELGY
ncbi:MAG TPA: D-sedoheptulose 7-phosphate isomerase [Xanthobacteraceae bacterium]|nr:D-sedoheptulose 7-phosphate isomerase [Xanthobacteraceae bacterium]